MFEQQNIYKGMRKYSNNPNGVIIAVFAISSGATGI